MSHVFYIFTPARLRECENGDDITRITAISQAATMQLIPSRLSLSRKAPHYDEHNSWNSNLPGSTLFMPVSDVDQQFLALLAMYVSNGYTPFSSMLKW